MMLRSRRQGALSPARRREGCQDLARCRDLWQTIRGAVGTPRPTNAVDWAGLAKVPGTLVVLMGLRNIQAIAATLIAHGRSPDTPVAIISRGTTGRQQTVVGTLDTIAELASRADISPPAVTVIGEVVNLREQLELV